MRLHSLILAILAAVGVASAQPPLTPDAPASVVRDLMSDDAATRTAAEAAAVRLGAPMVKPLCDLMAKDDTKSVTVAERALFAIAVRATAPDTPTHRDAVAQALAVEAGRSGSSRVRAYATQLLGLVGGRTPLEAMWLGVLLANPDTMVPALGALARIPAREATEVLLGERPKLGFPPPSMAPPGRSGPQDPVVLIIRTIGQRRDYRAVQPLSRLAQRGLPSHRAAALDALGMIADPKAVVTLAEAAGDPDDAVRNAAVGALIALADAEQQRGGDLARRCYRRAYDHAATPAQRTAALMGLADTDPAMRVQWLLRGMGEEHTRPVAYAELLSVDAGQLAGPLQARIGDAQGAELEAFMALAQEQGLPVPSH